MRMKMISPYFEALLLFFIATLVNGEDDTAGLIVKRNVPGDANEDLTPEAFMNLKSKVGLLESLITNMTLGIQQLVSQNEELNRTFVTLMFETIPREFEKVTERLSALENVKNTCKSFDNKTNETGRTESSLSGDSCGGVIEVEKSGELIYKEGKPYEDNENCVWTVVLQDAEMIAFELVSSGFENCCDFITVTPIDEDGVSTGPSFKLTSGNSTVSVEGPTATVTFLSDKSMTGHGFLLRYQKEI